MSDLLFTIGQSLKLLPPLFSFFRAEFNMWWWWWWWWFAGASEVPGSLLNMMRQLSIPITLALSYYLLRVRYNSYHYWACALIMGSVVLSFWVNYNKMDWGMLLFPPLFFFHHQNAQNT
jgi:hypothetical protein